MPSAVLIIGQNIAALQAAVECNVGDLYFIWEWVQEKCATFYTFIYRIQNNNIAEVQNPHIAVHLLAVNNR